MDTGMPRPAGDTRSDQEGFIIIEVLVSAIILAIVAGAVLTLITATTRSAASERDRATAYGLAQEAQARMRSMRISSLKNLEPVSETIGGTTFFVTSKGMFVNNTTGTASCSGAGATADYVELTSTVSSPSLPHPVSIHSIVSPSNESLDPSHGTFAFQTTDASGKPLAGVVFSGTGAGNFNGETNEEGCVTFADIPAGNYQVTTSSAGRINPEGLTNPTLGIGVEASGTTQHAFSFGYPGSVEAGFVYLEPKTNALTGASIDSMELFNAENEQKTLTYGVPGGTPTFVPKPLLDTNGLYPFKTPYAVYAGSCTSNNPDPEKKGLNPAAIGNAAVVAGGTLKLPTIQVPALNVSVTYESKLQKGAKIVVTDTKCQYNTQNVKRTFTTDELGHIVAAGNTAEELKKAEEAKTEAVGLPYGEYTVCASIKFTVTSRGRTVTEYRRAEKTVSVKSLTSAPVQALTLTTSTSECS
jgi:type II secretory pathway pseudopilin PulG